MSDEPTPHVFDAIEEGKKVSTEKGGEPCASKSTETMTDLLPGQLQPTSKIRPDGLASNAPAEESQPPGVGPTKKLPEEWSKELGMTVLDPDGWNRADFESDWLVPITKAEFQGKAARSTTRRDKYIPSRFAVSYAPAYRPLAPDEVPQAGDEHKVIPEGDWVKCDEFWSMRSATWLNIYQFRTTRPALQPAPVAGTPLTCPATGEEIPAPTFADIGELTEKLAVANAERDEWKFKATFPKDALAAVEAERDALRKALEDAPHSEGCAQNSGNDHPCNCWKSKLPKGGAK